MSRLFQVSKTLSLIVVATLSTVGGVWAQPASSADAPVKIPQAEPLNLIPVWTRLGDDEGRVDQERGTASVESAEFSPDGALVISGSKGRAHGDDARRGQAIKLWRVDQGAEVWTRPRADEVEAVAFAPDGRHVAAGGEDHLVEVLQVRGDQGEVLTKPRLVAELQREAAIDGLRFSHDGRLLAVGDENTTLTLYRTSDWQALATVRHGGSEPWMAVNQMDFSSSDERIATAGSDGAVKLWALEVAESSTGAAERATLTLDRPLGGHAGSVKSVRFSPDDRLLAAGAGGGSGVKVWNVQGKLVHEIPATGWIMETVAWTPDGRYLLTGGNEGEADDDNGPFSCDYDPQTCNGMGAIRAYEAARGFAHVMTKDVFRQEYLHVSHDGRQLISSHEDGTLRLWNVSYAGPTEPPGPRSDRRQ